MDGGNRPLRGSYEEVSTIAIKITQYDGPEHTFETVADYEAFLRTTKEELVHLEETFGTDEERQDVNEMWDRLYEKTE